ncbi:hypothetical protein AIOL_001392 [Candidatus Rhodobacter oscarellae]|uniref:N-acetyltransferase domain-containing protein n=1 Tax=Candidatus Rhodobacter oscarellae TaxID=1675527 RepID=A0A0J9GSG4_9RHOB|nr:GNAT family N-acetyltransferase [Candidatus Rhodobacter lobularis]KMW56438.1 hypothetical protein AIOL_001392 [Candidatus Rhodobacter lobularis]
MRIAAAQPRHAPRLARILGEWIRETEWMPNLHTPKEDLGFLRHLIEICDVQVLQDWRGVHGFLARQGRVVHALYLASTAQRQGYGKALLDHAKAQVPELELWTFQANTGARAFYAREGFREVELTAGARNDEKLPDVRLIWERSG